jgi:hypothetical protein
MQRRRIASTYAMNITHDQDQVVIPAQSTCGNATPIIEDGHSQRSDFSSNVSRDATISVRWLCAQEARGSTALHNVAPSSVSS